jgi:two-component system sensor histidine kinase BarA
VSYRTFKHLLGETSLERKCRFIFGGGILALITLSFYWYGQKTESLVIGQKTEAARARVEPIIALLHAKSPLGEIGRDLIDELSDDASSLNTHPAFRSHVILPARPGEKDHQPRDEFEQGLLAKFMAATSSRPPAAPGADADSLRKPLSFSDGTPTYEWRVKPGKKEYQYVEAVLFKPKPCIECHYHKTRRAGDGQHALTRPYDLAALVAVTLPMEQTNKDIHRNRAILISTALVTAILAMVTSWTIVRYVIVKPVKHLRDVSDAIAAGKLNIRSQIHTGDEFEELSHAFNRMLHNLVAMQQELRQVNSDLDRKVDELAQANLALFEMNRLKSDFLATMSHELRTPLNSIIGFSEVLASNDQLNERQRRYATNILNSGKMLLGMINDILDLAKIESGKMEVHVEDFSVRDLCEAVATLVRPMAEQKDLDLRCVLDETLPLLRQDPGKIKQIIYNLLSNAIKFTPEGGRVTLTAAPEGRNLVISVADTGIGIAAEDRERIFEKFRQAGLAAARDGVLTREHQGTGLGLSIVRELARLLGGSIELESELGKGSTFAVRLPMQLVGHRNIVVHIADQAVDLTKAKRVDPRPVAAPHAGPAGPHETHPRDGNGDPAARGETADRAGRAL